MPSDLARYFVQHPSISTKETCKACLSHLEGKKLDLQGDPRLKPHQKQAELLKKDAQSENPTSKIRMIARVSSFAFLPQSSEAIGKSVQKVNEFDICQIAAIRLAASEKKLS